MKILLLGSNGQVGWELQRSLAPLGELIALTRSSKDYCGDLSNLQGLAKTIQTLRPDVIVNAAAHTAVDKAEAEPEIARRLNALAPEILAQQALELGSLLVHYSTDYVFNGGGSEPWQETDIPAPLNVYGHSKLEGEQLIQHSGVKYLIFRTSWVYAARGNNFAKTMLRLAAERDSLSVIDDQFGAPTGAELIADVTSHAIKQVLIHPQDCGLYHLAAQGEVTWNGYARHVLERAVLSNHAAEIKIMHPKSVLSNEFPTAAQRPHNSRLNTEKIQEKFGLNLPSWQQGVDRMLIEFLNSN